MHVKDEQAWSQQLAEFEADEISRLFRDFLVRWVSTADKVLTENSARLTEFEGVNPPPLALSKAFEETEQTLGFISVEWLGQMLLVLVQHWVHGDELWESLSVWERRMVETAAALKIAELQELASGAAKELADAVSDTTNELD